MKTPKTLIVSAAVRYWEDATINGEPDTEDGDRIPLRRGGAWQPIIELETGKVRDWPEGTTASIHYKVCDAGEYWLGDDEGNKFAKWDGYYVPDDFLAVGDQGFGDYIILKIDGAGMIEGWEQPDIDESDWKPET